MGGRAAVPWIVGALLAAVVSGCSLAPTRVAPPGAEPTLPGEAPTLPGAVEALPNREPVLQVAVLTNAASAELSATSIFTVMGPTGEMVAPRMAFAAGMLLSFRAEQGDIAITWTSDTVHKELWKLGGCLLHPSGNGVAIVEGVRYRGWLKIALNPRGSLTVINCVGLEDYLRGVVPNEIGHADPALAEAVKAQAVAARTYALAYRGRYAAEGYDLLSTVADQVYNGVAGEDPASDRAIQETRGLVAVSHGQPIMTNYCSTCGGHTAGRDEVWDKPPLPYLTGVSDKGGAGGSWCAGSKYAHWRETWSGDDFWTIVRDNLRGEPGPTIPADAVLRDVRIEKRGPSGRVQSLLFATSRGDFRAGGDRLRWILERPGGAGPLWSTLFEMKVRRARGRVTQVTVDGKGWGHGVGMCQWGAMERSRRGQSCAEILKHYYRGIKLERLY